MEVDYHALMSSFLSRSKKAERHKAEEEHKTLTAQLLSIQATVATKKVCCFFELQPFPAIKLLQCAEDLNMLED